MEDLFFILLIILVCVSTYVNSLPFQALFPPCTKNLYSEGKIDFEAMIYNCSAVVPSPMQPPSYYPNNTARTTYSPTTVYAQLALNNLIRVDDQTNLFTLDFLLRIVWVDPRWYMPDLWKHLNPNALAEGMDILSYIQNTRELNIWLPDLVFLETTEMSTVSEFVRFYENGTFLWSRHIIGTFAEPLMDYTAFPSDHQNFTITLQSYSYSNQFVTLEFLSDNPIVLVQDTDGENSIEHNELWDYGGSVAFITDKVFPTFSNPNREFSTAYYSFAFDRQSQGFVFRYALPIMIFLIIVGISFWADLSQRVDVTLQVVIVVAALYLIVGQEVPVVGYLTDIDVYVTTIFGILTVAVYVHIVTIQFHRKREKYPLQLFFGEALVLIFRVVWIPLSILFFMCEFRQYNAVFISLFILSTLIGLLYGYLHIPSIHKVFLTAIYNLRLKESYFKVLTNPEVIEKPTVESIPYAEHKEKFAMTQSETSFLQAMEKVHLVTTMDGDIMKEEEAVRKRVSVRPQVPFQDAILARAASTKSTGSATDSKKEQ